MLNADVVQQLARRLCETLTTQGRRGRTIGIKIRLDDFSTHTRARTVAAPVAAAEQVSPVAVELLRRFAASFQRVSSFTIGAGDSSESNFNAFCTAR